mgnify:CR=1 FL=1
MPTTRFHRGLATLVLGLWSCAAAVAQTPGGDPLAASRGALLDTAGVAAAVVGGEIYVPAHSSLLAGDGRARIDFAVTLSVHNVSQARPLVLDRLDYFDGSGRLVQSYLAAPVAVRPFGTVEIFVAKSDVRAGTGANFVVGWHADGAIAEPLAEAVMIGDFANQSYSFVSRGQRIEVVPAPRR